VYTACIHVDSLTVVHVIIRSLMMTYGNRAAQLFQMSVHTLYTFVQKNLCKLDVISAKI